MPDDWLNRRLRYGWLEVTIAGSCGALVVLGFAFGWTAGLVAAEDPQSHAREYNSTGSDDDLCVMVSVLVFGVCFLAVGWMPSIGVSDWLKASVFTCTWFAQLLALRWIEVGSIFQTVVVDHNGVLLLWLAVYVVSPMLVWAFAIRNVARAVEEARGRRFAT